MQGTQLKKLEDKEINSPIEPLSNCGSADTLISVQQILDFWHLEL